MRAHDTNVLDDSYLAPSFNVAPQSRQPIVQIDSDIDQRELV
jgi:hypothetical protein